MLRIPQRAIGLSAVFASLPMAAYAAEPQDQSPQPPATERADDTTDASPARSGSAPATLSGVAPGAAGKDKYAYIDQFMEPGTTTTFPGSEDSVFQDAGGYRTWLADRGIAIRTVPSISVVDNFLSSGQPRDPQRFNGQRPTLQLAAQNMNLTWRMDALGLHDTQLIVAVNNTFTSYDANGINSAYVRNLAIYQKFFDGKLTVKAGITQNYYEYIGFYVGGSPILAAGIAGLLPIQAGLGADPSAVPVINVTGYGSRGKYVRVGIQRSMSPEGINGEVRRRSGLFDIDITQPGAKPLYIGEVGVRRLSKPGERQIWLRMGGFYNETQYTRFDGKGTRSNAALYALADRQLTQPDPERPAKGLYVGASAYWVRESVNPSTLSFEGRTFVVGPFASRPKDTAALRATWVKFSDDARRMNLANGQYANKDQLTVAASYSAQLYHGVYAVPALSYVNHPSFVGDFNPALIGAVSLSILL